MHGGQPANDGVIAHLHVASQRAVVRKNNSISNRAIVRDMAVGEKRATVADARFPFARRATADCDEFAERVFIADFKVSRFALIFQVLRLLTNRAGGVKFIPRTGAHRSAKRDMLLQPTIRAEHHVRTYYAIGTGDRSGADLCARIDNRGRVNLHVAHLSRNVNISSPSETIASFTTQWHFAFANRSPRALVSSAWIKMVSPGKTGLRNFTSSALMK